MRLSAITLSMCLIGAISVSSYPIEGSESEFKPTETTKSSSTQYMGSDSNKGGEVSPEDSSKPKKTKKGLFKWFGSKKEVGEPKEDPSKPKKTKKRLFKWLGSKKEAGEPKEDSPKPKEPTKRLFKWFGPKKKVKTPTETTKSSSKLSSVSDNDKPKEPQDPPTQKQSNEDINAPKKGPSRGSPSSIDEVATPDLIRQSDKYWEERNRRFPPGNTELGGPKRKVKLLTSSDLSEPKEPQDPPTQKQSNEDITTPKKGPSRGSSVSTGASTGSDMYIDTGSHQTKDNNKSTLGQTKVGAPKEDSLKPTETTKSSSKLSSVSDDDKPKEPQDPPTQKQSNEDITTPKKGPSRGSSVSTGASTGSDIRVEVPPEDSYKPTETTKKPFQWSKLKGNNGSSKGGSLKPKESAQDPSKLTNVSDDDGPKPLQDPPTQKQSNGVINAPKKGFNRGSSGPTGAAVGPNGAIDTGAHQAKESNDSTLGQTKGADSSIPNSSALESTNPDLSDQLIDPQEKRRPIPNPTPSKPTPEVTTVHEFLALDNPRVPLSHRQEKAFKLFNLLNKPRLQNADTKLYLLTRISKPEKERIEQEKMAAFFGSTYQIKQKAKDLRECERKIFSFRTSGQSLASQYSEAKKSQTKTIEKRALTDEEEGQYLIESCLTIRGESLSAEAESKRAWSELTDDQKRFYEYLKPVTKNVMFQLGM
ncbi:hypothetical protein BASA83_004734 [Batrachochytrium salamandrivorans]|nr:hypothetical protein BASA83_004734 [Batrachochytrium salamandrivorans]